MASRSAHPRPSAPSIPTRALSPPGPEQPERLPGRVAAAGLRGGLAAGSATALLSPWETPSDGTTPLGRASLPAVRAPQRGRDSPEQGAEEEAGAQGQEPAGRLPHRRPRLPAAAGQRQRILPGRGTAGEAQAAAVAAEEERPLERPLPRGARARLRRNATHRGASAAVTARRTGPLPPPPAPYPFTR